MLNTLTQCELWWKQSAPCAIHIDSGMERLGLNEDEMNRVLGTEPVKPSVIDESQARADEPDHGFNRLQIERFDRSNERVIVSQGGDQLTNSGARSSGLC